MKDWWEEYIGIPFKDNGLTREGASCWGLLRMVMKDKKNIDLPEYDWVDSRDLLRVVQAMSTGREIWAPVSSPQPFDGVLMRTDVKGRSIECHVGVMATESLMLHIEKATRSLLVRIDHPIIQRRIVGFYRYVGEQ